MPLSPDQLPWPARPAGASPEPPSLDPLLPDWYEHPTDPSLERFWDGREWTRTRPARAGSTPRSSDEAPQLELLAAPDPSARRIEAAGDLTITVTESPPDRIDQAGPAHRPGLSDPPPAGPLRHRPADRRPTTDRPDPPTPPSVRVGDVTSPTGSLFRDATARSDTPWQDQLRLVQLPSPDHRNTRHEQRERPAPAEGSSPGARRRPSPRRARWWALLAGVALALLAGVLGVFVGRATAPEELRPVDAQVLAELRQERNALAARVAVLVERFDAETREAAEAAWLLAVDEACRTGEPGEYGANFELVGSPAELEADVAACRPGA